VAYFFWNTQGRTQKFSLEGARSGWGLGRGGAPPQNFFLVFRWKWCICTHCLYLKSKLVSRSQLRRPRQEQQRQSNVRSRPNTEAITDEAMSSQDLKFTRFMRSVRSTGLRFIEESLSRKSTKTVAIRAAPLILLVWLVKEVTSVHPFC